jgi:hypothetical protein
MKPTTAAPLQATAEQAVVVFLRPSGFGSSDAFELFDGKKRYLGEAVSGIYWEVPMEPGEHWFYAGDAENVGILHANLAAGRRYYVVVRPYMGFWGARVELTGLAPRADDWQKREEWLKDSKRMAVDRAAGQAQLSGRAAELEEAMREGATTWQGVDAEWKAAHSLIPEDGIAEAAVAQTSGGDRLPAPAAAAAAPPAASVPVADSAAQPAVTPAAAPSASP